jgi:hypothetical protein
MEKPTCYYVYIAQSFRQGICKKTPVAPDSQLALNTLNPISVLLLLKSVYNRHKQFNHTKLQQPTHTEKFKCRALSTKTAFKIPSKALYLPISQ